MTDALPPDAPLAILVASGPMSRAEMERLQGALAENPGALVIGVDGGARHLLRVGRVPDVVTGDFDSLRIAECEALAKRGVTLVPTPDQNYTDLDKALTYARAGHGAERIRVYAATGGRLDHIYSVLSTLVKHSGSGDIRLVDAVGETWLVNSDVVLTGSDLPGRTLSLMALGRATGITTTGVRWTLTEETLAPGIRDGTLNEIVSEIVTIRVRGGDLLVQLHHAAPCYTETDADA
ncbi:MAG: thiamine diphosphokinase [Cytophagales bacterium]|nr:thiamine diphosphokinase [Armatimonadota bacterium]